MADFGIFAMRNVSDRLKALRLGARGLNIGLWWVEYRALLGEIWGSFGDFAIRNTPARFKALHWVQGVGIEGPFG